MREADFWCDYCNNLGTVECDCGGDLCVCLNNGERPCPHCYGGTCSPDEDDDWCGEHQPRTLAADKMEDAQ